MTAWLASASAGGAAATPQAVEAVKMGRAGHSLDEIVADQRFRRKTIESLNEPRLAAAMIHARERGNVSYFSNMNQRDEIAWTCRSINLVETGPRTAAI